MSSSYLLNTVTITSPASGPVVVPAGELISDAGVQASVAAAGGVLWPASDGQVPRFALIAQKLRARGMDENYISRTMMAAATASALESLNIFSASVKAARLVLTTNVASLTAGPITADSTGVRPGDAVLFVGQTTASQNGPYIATVTGTQAPNTYTYVRPDWWATGSTFNGAAFDIAEGALFAGKTWKAVGVTPPGVVDTTNLALYPKVVSGQVALVAGAATVSNLYITTTAVITAKDLTVPANTVTPTPTAGAGTGSLALAGTTTDLVAYTITNW
jgi:hypothetical protein